ncbi:MAG: hypothetical protein HZA93_13215 [Verrucomicrobia bacterium]|nr:hypothetical protein [Verrucomicrobiota bacterium]
MAGLSNQLSGPQFEAMLAELRAISAEPTLEQIRAVMIRYGIKSPTAKDGLPSAQAATTLRDGPFKRYLDRLNAGREAREQLCSAAGAGKHPVDAMEEMAAIELQDHFTSGAAIDIEWVTKQLVKLRASISMREESRRKTEDLERKQRETEAKLQLAEQREQLYREQIASLTAEREERERKKSELLAKIEGAKKKGGLTKESLAKIEEEARLL